MKIDSLLNSQTQIFKKVAPQLDMTTLSVGQATIRGLEIRADKDVPRWHPFFLVDKFEGQQYFEMEFVNVRSRSIMVGVATEACKGQISVHNLSSSVLYSLSESCVYYEGSARILAEEFVNDGDRIAVKVDCNQQTIEW